MILLNFTFIIINPVTIIVPDFTGQMCQWGGVFGKVLGGGGEGVGRRGGKGENFP